MRLFGRQIVGNALVHRRETEECRRSISRGSRVAAPYNLSLLAVDAGASDGDELTIARICLSGN